MKIFKKIRFPIIVSLLSILLIAGYAKTENSKIFSTKAIKALENLINADGQIYFRSGDDGDAYIDSNVSVSGDVSVTGDFSISGSFVADSIGIGATTPLTADFEIVSTGGENVYIYRYADSANPPSIKYWKARGTEASPTKSNDADDTGKLEFWGYARNSADSADAFVRTASIISEVDGVDAQDRIGGSLDFYTSSGVSINPTLKYTIGNTYTEIQNITTATAVTQYESWDQRLKCSVWDTTNTQAENRIMYWTLNAGSGAHGSEPYYLSLYDNDDVEIIRVDPMHTSPAVLIPDYLLHLGDVDTGIYFRDDRVTVYSGARTIIDAYETTQDYLHLGYDGSFDIDVKIGPDGCLSLEGSSKNLTLSGGTFDLGADDVTTTFTIHDAGTLVMYDDSDDTTVTIGPVADGTTTLDLTGSLEIKTSSANSAESLKITPQDVISTQSAEYDGIHIDGSALDPSEDDAAIHGIHIDFSGVSPSGANTCLGGLYIQTPVPDPANYSTCGFHLVNGGITHEFQAGTSTGTIFDSYNMTIDGSSLNSSSSIHAYTAKLTESNPSGTVAGLAVYSEIDPIHQHIQSFSTPSQTEYAGRYTGSFTDGIDTHEVFVAKNNEIWFGSTALFDAIEVIMSIGATRNCLCEFYYYNTGSSWIQFYPSDSTSGFQNSGLIEFESSGFTNWDAAGDPAGVDASAGYWLAIKRTVNADPGTPTLTTLKTGTDTLYYWDENGDIALRDIDALGGDLVLGSSIVAGTIAIHDAGVVTIYDDGDDTSVALGPVADGSTTLGVTGSLDVSGNVDAGNMTISSGSIVDSSGAISFDNENMTMLGTLDLGADDDISTLTIHDAGTIVINDDSDDTTVTIGPVADGTTTLGVTGSVSISADLHVTDYINNVGDLDTRIDFDTDDTLTLLAGNVTNLDLVETGSIGYFNFLTGAGDHRFKVWRVAMADEGTDSLDVSITDSAKGTIIATNSGVIDAWAEFILGGDGTVILIANSVGNVSANADVDGDLCIGTAAAQEPLTIKNRLGGARNVRFDINYF